MFSDEQCNTVEAEESVQYDQCSQFNDPFSRLQFNVIVRQEVPDPTEEPEEPPKNETVPDDKNTTQPSNNQTSSDNTTQPEQNKTDEQ